MNFVIPLIARQGIIFLEPADRYKGLFAIGTTGTGKTSFFLNLINEEKDNALIVLDPNGDLAERVASLIPEDRLIYVDKDNPLSLNPLTRKHLTNSENIHELVEAVNSSVQAFNPNQVDISVKMARILTQAVEVIPKEKLTIEYLSNFLDSPSARQRHFGDKPRNTYWKEFENKGTRYEQLRMSAERVADRFSLLYSDENLKPFIEGENQFNIPDIAVGKKAVIFNLHGFDDETTSFIGCLIAIQLKSYYLHQAAKDSPPVYFYCDEYHLFITNLFDRFLTECRKYNISCSFSGHSLKQVDRKLASMMKSCYVLAVLGCGHDDAEEIASELNIKAQEILALKDYKAILGVNKKPHLVLVEEPPHAEPYRPEKGVYWLREDWIVVE